MAAAAGVLVIRRARELAWKFGLHYSLAVARRSCRWDFGLAGHGDGSDDILNATAGTGPGYCRRGFVSARHDHFRDGPPRDRISAAESEGSAGRRQPRESGVDGCSCLAGWLGNSTMIQTVAVAPGSGVGMVPSSVAPAVRVCITVACPPICGTMIQCVVTWPGGTDVSVIVSVAVGYKLLPNKVVILVTSVSSFMISSDSSVDERDSHEAYRRHSGQVFDRHRSTSGILVGCLLEPRPELLR